jgi:DNA-binding CsgD family transcriptional regulator
MNILATISKQEAIALLELIRRLTACKTFLDISDALTDLARLVGFEYAVYGLAKLHANGLLASYKVVNISYPYDWLSLYDQRKFYSIDPICRDNFSNYGVQYWEETYRRLGKPKEFVSIAEDFGLKAGYTCGIRNYRRTEGSIFSIAGQVQDFPLNRTILNLLYPHVDLAFRAVLTKDKQASSNLSTRESEVLTWIKNGKSTWDISIILNISERTVKYHVGNIMKKLNAVSRIHALAIALTTGQIDIE